MTWNRGLAVPVGILMLLAVILIFPGSNAQQPEGVILKVGPGQVYTSIQDAVDNATAGDVIEVEPGLYNENVVVDKRLTIRGSGGKMSTLVNGSAGYTGILLKADGCVVDGMSVGWTYFGYGFAIQGDDCMIINSFSYASYCGVYVTNARGALIKNCDLSHNSMAGVAMNGSTDCLILDTVIEHNNAYIGDPSGVVLVNSTGNLIYNCTIQLIYGDGIALYHSWNNEIIDCDLRFNMNGIDILHSNGNTISGNICDSNMNGIRISGASSNNVTGNKCNKNTNGILLDTAQDTRVADNICNNNDAAGIYLASARGNEVVYNTLENNSVSLTYGIFLNSNSTKNRMHHNILKNNNHGNVQAVDNGENNTWDNGGEGNFWWDWKGPDENGDGIVDEPYDVGGRPGAKDRYPLTVPPGGSNSPGIGDNGLPDGNETGDNEISPYFFPALTLVVIVVVILLILFRRLRGKNDGGSQEPVLRQI